MKYQPICIVFFPINFVFSCSPSEKPNLTPKQHEIPHLKKQGNRTQLIVEDKPFIVLGGELGNSSFTSVVCMDPIWPKLKAMNLDAVLVPVYWELIELEKLKGKVDNSRYPAISVELDLTIGIPSNVESPVPIILETIATGPAISLANPIGTLLEDWLGIMIYLLRTSLMNGLALLLEMTLN